MNNSDMVFIRSASDSTIVLSVPNIPVYRVWKKKGQTFPIERDKLVQAYYEPSVSYLFACGLLVTDDKDFMKEVGLMEEVKEGQEEVLVTELDEKLAKRMIALMPLADFKVNLEKLSQPQIQELADYAIFHYTELKGDRVDLLSKATGRNIYKSIENFKKSEE